MENITNLIKYFTGYEVPSEDISILEYMEKVERQRLINELHTVDVPQELEYVIEYRVAGQYLATQKGKVLGDEALQVVKSIKEGDTTVEIGGSTAEERFDNIIQWLIGIGRGDVLSFRQIKW